MSKAEEAFTGQAAETNASKNGQPKSEKTQPNNEKTKQLQVYTPAELKAFAPEALEYVAYPLAAKGMITLIDGAPKTSGKTTLIMYGFHSVLQEELFLNHATKHTNILLITEENARTVTLAIERAGLTNATGLYIVPWSSLAGFPWVEIVDNIEKICVEREIGWLVVDTFFGVVGLRGEEEYKPGVAESAVAPLRYLVGKLDIACSLSRHERKSGGDIGQSGRGSNALTGAVDVVVLLKRMPASYSENMRQLEMCGRAEQAKFVIELVNGKYIAHENSGDLKTENLAKGELIEDALKANPNGSIREIAGILNMDKSFVHRWIKKQGWFMTKDGWKKGEDQ